MASFLKVLCLFIVLSASGCATLRLPTRDAQRPSPIPQPLAVEEVPVPSTTPFDASPILRAAYLDGYRLGYRFAVVGEGISNCGWSQAPVFRAGQRGVDDGQRDGLAARKIAFNVDLKTSPEFESAAKYVADSLNQSLAEEAASEPEKK